MYIAHMQVWRGLIALNISTVTGVIDIDVTADTVKIPTFMPIVVHAWTYCGRPQTCARVHTHDVMLIA